VPADVYTVVFAHDAAWCLADRLLELGRSPDGVELAVAQAVACVDFWSPVWSAAAAGGMPDAGQVVNLVRDQGDVEALAHAVSPPPVASGEWSPCRRFPELAEELSEEREPMAERIDV
jgi:hypothetical protein